MTSLREKAGRVPALVHRQFNSPLLMYSPEAVAETLDAHMKVLKTGAVGCVLVTASFSLHPFRDVQEE